MVIALTGAGISKASGIPTFEDQGDMRLKLSRGYASKHVEEYNKIILNMQKNCNEANPNDAHMALAEYEIPIITMNIDGLHERAGSKHVLNIHGKLPDIVLYEDQAPAYSEAYSWIETLREEDVLIIIGTSFFTNIASQLKYRAELVGVKIILINESAEIRLRKTLKSVQYKIESYDTLLNRISNL